MNKLLWPLGGALLVAAIVLFATGQPLYAGFALTGFFLTASFGVRASERLRGISFSLVIFAAVTFAMCFPAPLVSWGSFKLSVLIVPLLQIIMFGMGELMSTQDFIAVVKAPKAVALGLVLQYTIMPFMGLAIAVNGTESVASKRMRRFMCPPIAIHEGRDRTPGASGPATAAVDAILRALPNDPARTYSRAARALSRAARRMVTSCLQISFRAMALRTRAAAMC
jgi:hypothetical protein